MKNQLKVSYEPESTREQLLELLYWIILVCMWFAISASLLRSIEMGFRVTHYIQIGLALTFILFFIFRQRFNYIFRVYFIISIIFLLATGGIHSFGLYSQSPLFFLLATSLAFIFLDFKRGMLVFISSIVILLLTAFFFYTGIVHYNPPVHNFNISVYGWIMAVIVYVLITFTISLFEYRLFGNLIKNTNRLVEQEQNLNKVNKLLQKEIEIRKQTEALLKQQYNESTSLNEEYQQLNLALHEANELLQKSNYQLTEAKEKAQAADKLKSAFLSNMSHEIRTPMNAILGFSTLLNTDDITSEDAKRYISIIQSSSNNLLNIISDIVTMSKIESRQFTLYPEPIDINEFIDEVVEKYTAEVFIQRDSSVQFEVESNLPNRCKLIIDKECLKQIVSKLLENAIKFTTKGTIRAIFNLQDDSMLQFSVIDTGIGIGEKEKQIIFNIFNQADGSNTRKHGGVGLGLSITKGLLELLNGQIRVESNESIGSTFVVQIPVINANNNEEHDDLSLSQYSSKNIVVVGKSVWDNLLFNKTLQQSKAVLSYIEFGYQAIEFCLENSNIDLMFVSANLPDSKGIDIIEAIKKINPKLPIVLYSVENLKSETLNAVKIDSMMTEPIEKGRVLDLLKRYLS